MKPWKLRLCKGAPCAALAAWLCYVSVILADPTQVPAPQYAVILSALTLVCVFALTLLFWALRRNDQSPRRRFETPLYAVPDAAMPAAPVWPHVPQQRPAPNAYGIARSTDRVEEELRQITRDEFDPDKTAGIIYPRPDDPRNMAS